MQEGNAEPGWPSSAMTEVGPAPSRSAEARPGPASAATRGLALTRLDAVAIASLGVLAVAWGSVYWRAGLHCNPDAGYYLYFGSRLHLHFDYRAGSAMYPPFFPALIALAMFIAEFPGQAAVLVIASSLFVTAAGTYVATRMARAPFYLAFFAALMVCASPATAKVYESAWADGPLVALIVAALACFGAWVRTERRVWFALACVAIGLAAITKYVAVLLAAPLLIVALCKRGRSLTRWELLHLASWTASAGVPVGLVFTYNRIVMGVFTGHPDSGRSLRSNWNSLHANVKLLLPVYVGVVCLLGLAALGYWLWRRERTERRDAAFCWAATALFLVVYTVGLVGAASRVHIVKLDLRLATPVVLLVLLLAAQSMGVLLSVFEQRNRWLEIALKVACAGWLLEAGLAPARGELDHLRHLFSPSNAEISRHRLGSGNSATERALRAFVEAELKHKPTIALCFLELTADRGGAFRDWYATASSLARSPLRAGHPQLIDSTRRVIEIAPRGKRSKERVFLLVPAMPDLKMLRQRRPKQLKQALAERTNNVLDRVANVMKNADQKELWLLAAKHGTWFQPETMPARSDLTIARANNLAGYVAFKVEMQPLKVASKLR